MLSWLAVAGAAASEVEAATFTGEAVCRSCHGLEARHWGATIHATIFRDHPRTKLERRSCEACHGPGSRHLADPKALDGIVRFTRDGGTPIGQQNTICLACHSGEERLYWTGSTHDREELGCADCHNPMAKLSAKNLLRESNTNETCFACHPAQRMQFRKRSHMPLHEGKIDCADCHNPHGSSGASLIRADSINQLCYQCHAAKRGPFLWEHAPVSENCLECHLPHGSNREALLVSSPPLLCQQCHSQISIRGHVSGLLSRGNLARRDERVLNRSCANCHSQIHGSNHPSGARFHR